MSRFSQIISTFALIVSLVLPTQRVHAMVYAYGWNGVGHLGFIRAAGILGIVGIGVGVSGMAAYYKMTATTDIESGTQTAVRYGGLGTSVCGAIALVIGVIMLNQDSAAVLATSYDRLSLEEAKELGIPPDQAKRYNAQLARVKLVDEHAIKAVKDQAIQRGQAGGLEGEKAVQVYRDEFSAQIDNLIPRDSKLILEVLSKIEIRRLQASYKNIPEKLIKN
jgi:hypothetical protein